MFTAENLVILVRGEALVKGSLVDVWWRENTPTKGIMKRRAVSLVHMVGQEKDLSGFLVTDRTGKLVPVVSRDVSDIKVLKRAQ